MLLIQLFFLYYIFQCMILNVQQIFLLLHICAPMFYCIFCFLTYVHDTYKHTCSSSLASYFFYGISTGMTRSDCVFFSVYHLFFFFFYKLNTRRSEKKLPLYIFWFSDTFFFYFIFIFYNFIYKKKKTLFSCSFNQSKFFYNKKNL